MPTIVKTPDTVELIDIDSIDLIFEEDGSVMNPRGDSFETTDLQSSMRKNGQLKPIVVMRDPETGRHLLLDGNRRWNAAKALDWTLISAEFKPFSTDRAVQRAKMIAAQLHEQPKPSRFGLALARQQLEDKWSVERVAELAGKSVPTVKLLIALAFAKPEIQAKVDDGTISLSAFAEFADKPESVQEEIAKLPKAGVRDVRKALKKERIKAERAAKQAQPALTPEPAPKAVNPSPFASVLEQLNDEPDIEEEIVDQMATDFFNLARRIAARDFNAVSLTKIAAALELAGRRFQTEQIEVA